MNPDRSVLKITALPFFDLYSTLCFIMTTSNQSNGKIGKYVQNSIVSYLWQEPYCTLPWIKKVIRESAIPSPDLKRTFRDLVKEYGNRKRFRKLFDICRNANFNYRPVE